MKIQPDNDQAVNFLKHYGATCTLVAIHPVSGRSTAKAFSDFSDTTQLYDWIAKRNGLQNLYFHVNPTIILRDKKSEKADIKEVRYLHVDIDPRTGENIQEEQTRISTLLKAPPPGVPLPSLVIFSGGGYQAFWKLSEPIFVNGDLAKAADMERYNIQLALMLGGDNCHDISRIMRLPGTINIPNKTKASKGRVPALADVVEMLEHTFSLSEFSAAAEIRVSGKKQTTLVKNETIKSPLTITIRPDELDLSRLPEEEKNKVIAILINGPTPEYHFDGDRSAAIFYICCTLIRADISDDKIVSILLNRDLAISHHIYERGGHNPQKYVARQLARALARQPRPGPVLNQDDPMNSARLFLELMHPNLKRYNADYLEYDGACYQAIENVAVLSWIWNFLDSSFQWNKDSDPKPFKPTKAKVSNVLEAVQCLVHIDRAEIHPPVWLDDNILPAKEIIACRNGLIHLPTAKLLPSTPYFFTRNALDFNFDENASTPEIWINFLSEVWPNDDEAINTLQEIFGYCLTPDTSQQKIFLLVGPSRSGKGTIGRVLCGLVGERNVCSPRLDEISQGFGLQSLLGRQLALVSDMRLGHKTDSAALAENLLRLSGEDSVSVQRKHKDNWEGKLATRFFIITNELPYIADASGALGNRFIILQMTESFLGREDTKLSDKLVLEMPGILKWAIIGWRRLNDRGNFLEPISSQAARDTITSLGAPIKAFVAECCILSSDQNITKDDLFFAYKNWCRDNDIKPWTKEVFSKKLFDAYPKIRAEKILLDGDRTPCYSGISLFKVVSNERPVFF